MSVTSVESTGSFYLRVSTFVYTYVGSYQFVTVQSVLLLAVQEVEEEEEYFHCFIIYLYFDTTSFGE